MLTEKTVQSLSEKYREPAWIAAARLQALHQFSQLPMPVFKYGLGIFTSTQGLQLESLDPLSSQQFTIKSSPGIEVLSIKQASEEYPELIREALQIVGQKNKLAAFHQAFFNHLTILKIPKNTTNNQIEMHLNLLATTFIDYLIIIAESNTEATILETSISSCNQQHLRSQILLLKAGENAKLQYYTIQNLNPEAYQCSHRYATLAANSTLQWIDCQLGSKFTQSSTITHLEGEGSSSTTQGMVFADHQQTFDIDVATKHAADSSTSDMLTKLALNHQAKAIYRGLVKIYPHARNCQGYQRDETILLSKEAQSNAVPNLEIENNEVRCTHGAVMSNIDEDKLFYMTSRGIDEATAKKSIVEGFFQPIIDKIPSAAWQEHIQKAITARLGALQ